MGPTNNKGNLMDTGLIVQGEGHVRIGERCTIAKNAQIIFAQPGSVDIGDYCVIGPGVKIVVNGGAVRIGDWTSLHDNCLLLCTQGLTIGQHGWFGQNAVLDGSGGLVIGNGVRVGMFSQLWSHVAAGEQIEGCTLYGMRPLVLEDDVWLVGSCICASGITIGRRTVALIGSNITKSWAPGLVIAGSPASVKEGLSFYKDITLDEKFFLLRGWVEEVVSGTTMQLEEIDANELFSVREPNGAAVVFVKRAGYYEQHRDNNPQQTLCCVENKRYTKRLTEIEQRLLKPLSGNKVRFLAD